MIAQWYGEFYLKIGLEIATPLLLATVGISAVAFGARSSRAFGLGVTVASIPALALTTTQFGMLLGSGTPWIDPEMWGPEAHNYFVGTLIWGSLAIILGVVSTLTMWLCFPEPKIEK